MNDSSNGPHKAYPGKLFSEERAALEDLDVSDVALPAALIQKARTLLTERLGESEANKTNDKIAEGYAYGGLGLLAQHTSYYNGFAVILSLSHATAVVIRPSGLGKHQVIFDESIVSISDSKSVEMTLVTELLEKFLPADTFVDVGVVSAIPAGCLEAFYSSLSVAVVKAVFDFQELPLPEDICEATRHAIEGAIKSEFSKAFVLVSLNIEPNTFCVIDTETEELIPFPAPSKELLRWALIEVETATPRNFDFYHACGELGEEALELLQKGAFARYSSFRDVQHVDLIRVLNALPKKYRPIVRHLVNENKRVQAMIGAIRGEDWQKLGGLLYMSHFSLSTEWHGTNKTIDFVVSEAQRMSTNGIYGACMTGRGGIILTIGLPLAFPVFLKEIKKQLKEQFNREPRCLLL